MCVFSVVLIAFTALSMEQIIKMSCAFTCCCHLTSFFTQTNEVQLLRQCTIAFINEEGEKESGKRSFYEESI